MQKFVPAALTLSLSSVLVHAQTVTVPAGEVRVIESGKSVLAGDYEVFGTLLVEETANFRPDSVLIKSSGSGVFSAPGTPAFVLSSEQFSTITLNDFPAFTGLNVAGDVDVWGGVSVSGSADEGRVQTRALFTLSEGGSIISRTFEQSNTSTLRGVGTVTASQFTLDGFLEPGNSEEANTTIGTLNLVGTGPITLNGGLLVEIGRDASGGIADQVAVTGDFVASGDLFFQPITLGAGERFTVGESFDLVTATSVTGQFDLLTGTDVFDADGNPVGSFEITYSPTAVTATFVPEPTVLIALLPLVAMLRRRRAGTPS